MVKIIIAGSRNLEFGTITEWFNLFDDIWNVINIFPSVIFSGCSGTVDLMGAAYATNKGIFLKDFPADWNKYKLAAGPIRNQQMVNEADMLLLIWDGESKGSLDVLTKAEKKGLIIYEMVIKNGDDRSPVIRERKKTINQNNTTTS